MPILVSVFNSVIAFAFIGISGLIMCQTPENEAQAQYTQLDK